MTLICKNCLNAIRSRGERVFTTPFDDMIFEDTTRECEFCGDDYSDDEYELNIILEEN